MLFAASSATLGKLLTFINSICVCSRVVAAGALIAHPHACVLQRDQL